MMRVLRIIVAIILGETSLVLLTTVAQEVAFDGISYTTSSRPVLFFGGLLTVLAAVISGMIMVWILRKNPSWIAPFVVSIFISAESTYLILSDITGDPVWFDTIAAFSLILGIWIGYGYKSVLGLSRYRSNNQ